MENQDQKPEEKVVTIGRNEPCPCGSGKKYKRCCGVNAAPKLSAPREPAPFAGGFNPKAGAPGFDPKMMENMDPQWMMQVSQALQRLPKGQLQRLQTVMQKAMNGKDVTAEAQELEKNLPPEFQSLMQSWAGTMGGLGGGGEEAALPGEFPALPGVPAPENTQMTEEQARLLVEQAAKSGVISTEQAESLLTAQEGASSEGLTTETAETEESAESKKGGFWKRFTDKANP